MTTQRPVILSLALDHDVNDVVRAAAEVAARLGAPLLPAHALSARPLEGDAHLVERIAAARRRALEYLAPASDEGAELLEPVIARAHPAELAARTAMASDAQLVVTGGGSPPTVRRWVVGSIAERIVRISPVPVYLARGTRPDEGMPILCPIDLSPQSRIGVHAAARMARVFGTKLVTLTAIPVEEKGWLDGARLEHELEREERVARGRVEEFLAAQDLSGIDVEPRVVVGNPAQRIVEASEDAWLLVVASRSFADLRHGTIGEVAERALRYSRCNALAVRDDDPARDRRETEVRELAELKARAEAHLAAGETNVAVSLLRFVADHAPANASVHEALAHALDVAGERDEAARRRALANVIRSSFG